jgi:hypothetical protein
VRCGRGVTPNWRIWLVPTSSRTPCGSCCPASAS